MATTSFEFMGIGGSAYDVGGSAIEGFLTGGISDYFGRKSEKRALNRQLALMNAQYDYAQRYAENSPSWNVQGLRNAGLNPILAVSNGAHLGATVPSAPSVASHVGQSHYSDSKSGFEYDPLVKSRLAVDSATVKNLDAQSEAALIRANSQEKKDAADIALRSVETEKLKGSKFDSSIMRDAEKVIKDLIDIPNQLKEVDPYTPYIQNKPKLPSETNTQYLERLKKPKSGDCTRLFYKSRRKFPDGSNVHRKFGDVGGMLPVVR